jgi:hypothetical protein
MMAGQSTRDTKNIGAALQGNGGSAFNFIVIAPELFSDGVEAIHGRQVGQARLCQLRRLFFLVRIKAKRPIVIATIEARNPKAM